MTSCDCRALFNDNSQRNLAAVTEQRFPNCHCEQFGIGQGSRGRIDDDEILYRILTDPIDLDQETGQIAREAFEQAYKDGLSIIREHATDAEVEAVVKDILSVKPDKERRTIRAIFEFRCVTIRDERCIFQNNQQKAFCVYDQTVPRLLLEPNEPPVPAHGTILSRRLFELPTTRRQFQNDCNDTLHRIITARSVGVATFRNGLLTDLNARSLAGEFVRAA